MKKFLSILLALAVGFTFTFGSAMSAFAAKDSSGNFVGYTVDEAKTLLQDAMAQAKADTYTVDYSNDHDSQTTKDYTSWKISAEHMQAGIQAGYDKVLEEINKLSSESPTLIVKGTAAVAGASASVDVVTGVIIGGSLTPTTFTGNATQDKGNMATLLETYSTGNGLVEAEKVAFADYQAYLTGLVDKVDTSVYTDTNYKDNNRAVGYTAKDEKTYDTSIEAANADIAYAKAVISNAKFAPTVSSSDPASAIASWNVATYEDLYEAVFATDKSKTIRTEVAYDEIVETKDIGLTYKLTGNYSTKASEAGDAAKLSAAQALAKARLAQLVATYQAGNDYKSSQDAEIAAYIEAQTYVIENTTVVADVNKLLTTTKNDKRADAFINANVAKGKITVPYSQRCASAVSYKSDMEALKTNCTTRGYTWDADKATEVMTAALIDIYNGKTVTADASAIIGANLTAGDKAEAKIDLSEIVADTANVAVSGPAVNAEVYTFPRTFKAYSTENQATTTVADGYTYFEKQWDTVKTAVDAYNTAVDAAVTQDDVKAAAYTLYVAIKDIKASTIYTEVAKNNNFDSLKKYAGLTYDRAKAANNNVAADIFVKFYKEVAITASAGTGLSADNVNLWYIAQGATDKASAEAMYADACKVIDAYKTLAAIKGEAAAVTAQINALPAKASDVKLTDKAAIVAAFDAYDALAKDAQKYVTNTNRLNADIEKVKELEEYDLKVKAAALPKKAVATTANKEAIKAYKDAYETYAYTTAYEGNAIVSPYDYVTALKNIKTAEGKAINAQYNALAAKANAGTLTAEDATAVKALQDAIAAYIDEYKISPSATIEMETAKIAATVAKLVEAEKWTDADAKAYVFDQATKATSVKLGAKKVKVTANFDASKLIENGYTVEYKFYKSTKKSSGYKYTGVTKPADNATYTNTNAKKGKNYYKFKIVVKNADGTVILTTALKDCKYACRTIK